MGLLIREERDQLIILLTQLPNVDLPEVRSQLLANLPSELRKSIRYSDITGIHLGQIVDGVTNEAWGQLSDGSLTLDIVVQNARLLAKGSRLDQPLEHLIVQIATRTGARRAFSPPPLAPAPPPPLAPAPLPPAPPQPGYSPSDPVRPPPLIWDDEPSISAPHERVGPATRPPVMVIDPPVVVPPPRLDTSRRTGWLLLGLGLPLLVFTLAALVLGQPDAGNPFLIILVIVVGLGGSLFAMYFKSKKK